MMQDWKPEYHKTVAPFKEVNNSNPTIIIIHKSVDTIIKQDNG